MQFSCTFAIIKNEAMNPKDVAFRTTIKPEDIDTFVTERSEQVGNRTFNLDLETLHMVFRFAIARGMILDNPASHVERRKLEHRQPIIPTKEEFSLLVSTIRKIDPRACYSADLLELLAYSGMRVGEAATSLKWRHVDFQRRTLHITGGAGGTKNHHERTIPLFPSLEKFLVDLKERRMRQLKLRRLDDFSVVPILSAKIAINSACKAANLQHFPSSPLSPFLLLQCHRGKHRFPYDCRLAGTF